MAGRVREHAWEATPLGPAETWPQSFKAIVDMLLSSGFAMAAMWGRDLIQIYNDAYARLIGPEHPDALGRAARESWEELWDLSGPVIQQVLSGETRTFVDVPQAIAKNGVAEDRWFTNCYSPLRDEKGVIAGVLVTLLETTERVRSEAALRDNESRLRLALDATEMGTWTWNLETGTAELDARAAQILGLPGAGMTNEAEAERAAVHPEDLARAQAEGAAGIRSGEPFTVRYRTIHPDQSVHHVVSRGRTVRGGAGKPIRVVGTNRDVTAEHELEQQRERFLADATAARAEADQQDRTKDQFLITLSHELRTPLASILLWARALRSGSVSAQDFGRATDAIVQSAESQLQLIEDLVDLSRLKSGLIQLDLQTTSVDDVARATLQMIGPTAEAKKLSVELDVAPDVGEAMFDRGRYQQVLWNVLSNAVKFTSEGGRVSLRIRKDGDQLEAVVTDTGQGIDPDFLPQLFQRFRRADMREKRRYGGLGVGLALCRHLVDLHGGTIEGRSEGHGRGATFIVRIPWIAPDTDPGAQDIIAVAAAGALTTLSGLRVLVVEDDENMRDIMRWTLEGAGARVLTVSSGTDALTVIDATAQAGGEPDVLVCDLGLPGMNGYDLIGQVLERRRARGKKAIPACAVSAFVRDIDRERAIDAGFDSYIKKPMTAQRLIEAVVELAAVASENESRA
jgi:signal transduction histidine kinase/ActR/RegA family two-component response regulator